MAVYDPEKTENLNDLTGISKAEERDMDARARAGVDQDKAASRDQLKNAESSSPPSQGLYSGPERMNPLTRGVKGGLAKLRITKRKGIIGGLAGGVVGGGLFLGMISTGPLTLIHLSQMLRVPGINLEVASDMRIGKLLRSSRTGHIGETRLSWVGSKINKRFLSQLAKEGITIETKGSTGKLSKVIVDADKNTKYSKLGNDSSIRKAMAEEFSVTENEVRKINGKFVADIGETNIRADRKTARSLASHTNKGGLTGKIIKGVNFRTFSKFIGSPGWLHTVERSKLSATRKVEGSKVGQKLSAWREGVKSTITAKIPSDLKSRLSPHKGKVVLGSGGSLMVAGAMCDIRDIAGLAVEATRAYITLPAAQQATAFMSLGDQIKSGEDIDPELIGEITGSLVDEKGESVFDSAAMKALQGEPGGTPVSDNTKGSFSSESTGKSIKQYIDSNLGGDIVCSTPGRILQAGAGIALFAATLGAGNAGLKLSNMAIGAVATMALFNAINDIINDKALPENITGPEGGEVLAYGSRELHNMSAISNGGAALDSSEDAVMQKIAAQDEEEEFQSKNLAYKLFNKEDQRSVLGSIVHKQVGGSQNIIASVTRGISSMFSAPSLLLSSFSGRAQARTYDVSSYPWGFSAYGFSWDELNNPDMEDPYENAENVAVLLNGDKGSDYTEKATKCFGMKIEKTNNDGSGELWSVTPDKEIDIRSSDYPGNDSCRDKGNMDWLRLRMFIMDTRTLDAYACYEGEAESCQALGIETVSAETVAQGESAGSGSFELLNQVNGYDLSADEAKHIKYIAENVMPLLPGNAKEKVDVAARVTWWSLKEGILGLKDPFGYSNCKVPVPGTSEAMRRISPGGNNNYIDLTQVCPEGRSMAWQVGISGVQVPNFELPAIKEAAEKIYPGKSIRDILADVAKLVGAQEGTPNYNKIVNSTGYAQRSFLLRDPAIGFYLVDKNIRDGCISSWESWCGDYGSAKVAPLAKDKATAKKAIEDLEGYFTSAGSGDGGSSAKIIGDPMSSSVSIPCPNGTKDAGVHDAYIRGGKVKMRLCAVQNLPCGNEECIEFGGGKALVSSRAAGAVYAMVEDAKKDGITLTSNSTFRTHAHQTTLWNGSDKSGNSVARPGHSLHQSGNAIDFGNMGGSANGSQSCSSRMTWNSAEYRWMKQNAKKYGYKQYSAEAWHWDTLNTENRC